MSRLLSLNANFAHVVTIGGITVGLMLFSFGRLRPSRPSESHYSRLEHRKPFLLPFFPNTESRFSFKVFQVFPSLGRNISSNPSVHICPKRPNEMTKLLASLKEKKKTFRSTLPLFSIIALFNF